MRTLVIGGHTRNIGKSALVVDVIRALPAAAWTAVKITQCRAGVCPLHGESCACAPSTHTVVIDEEHERSDRADTTRFLAAGARRAFWMRCQQGSMAEAMPSLRQALAGAGNVVIESNTLLEFLRPELYLVVLDPRCEDFKASARLVLDQADAFVLRAPWVESPWGDISKHLFAGRPAFLQPLDDPLPEALVELVRCRVVAM